MHRCINGLVWHSRYFAETIALFQHQSLAHPFRFTSCFQGGFKMCTLTMKLAKPLSTPWRCCMYMHVFLQTTTVTHRERTRPDFAVRKADILLFSRVFVNIVCCILSHHVLRNVNPSGIIYSICLYLPKAYFTCTRYSTRKVV